MFWITILILIAGAALTQIEALSVLVCVLAMSDNPEFSCHVVLMMLVYCGWRKSCIAYRILKGLLSLVRNSGLNGMNYHEISTLLRPFPLAT